MVSGGDQRVFVGLFPPRELSQQLHAEASSLLNESWARPVIPERYHMTLCFVGPLGELESSRLQAELPQLIASREAFELELGTGGSFGSGGPGSVHWIGAAESSCSSLEPLRRAVREAVSCAGISPAEGDRPWRPHMTIARTRRHVPADSIQALADHSFGLGTPWRVKEVRVALSGPGLTGAYPELGRHPLAPDGACD